MAGIKRVSVKGACSYGSSFKLILIIPIFLRAFNKVDSPSDKPVEFECLKTNNWVTILEPKRVVVYEPSDKGKLSMRSEIYCSNCSKVLDLNITPACPRSLRTLSHSTGET